ncbi:MAG: hypothetical protein A2172_04710 [Candidatus Woykebacteria bacterium RBG_13_40_15]|uniref:Excinuclease ABC subunit C n=1 Tax=Candidatus Woykebacteria bacterium RBG_13_40_15 TaxID=1802593 RepID=A0A1G1W724_9BACT|nr:MAG: hypothetical protein A2172_04710 [Candidatus Woykebacteria bacterium RBG_13_40_15]
MQLNLLPQKTGVYIFRDGSGKPIYIGKAINIKKRVKNHFDLKDANYRQGALIEKTKKIEDILVDSEIEALLLEANLIKKYKPAFNSQLKDDKDYLYIKITNDQFPQVLTARKKDLGNAKIYFGPFPSVNKVRETLKALRKIFPFSIHCKPGMKRACLGYHLGLCPGVCVGKISEKEYKKTIASLKLFLQGRKKEVLSKLNRELGIYSKRLEYEKASEIKNKIEAVSYITRPTRNPSEYLEEEIGDIHDRELLDLAKNIGMASKPVRIESYDVSNLFGKQATGSMIVFTNGEPDKNEYRRFRIKTIRGISDIAMLDEVLERRFKNKWPTPDLIVVDGGKTQLNTTLKVVKKIGFSGKVISLAKKFEQIYLPIISKPLILPRNSDALKLIQRLRDEAHRFAISYHRKLRGKQFLTDKN